MSAARAMIGAMHADVTIIGAGLSGLCCAGVLARAGARVVVLEASDGVGGRVRTDVVEGFRLDRGFQVYLTAYPEAAGVLDHAALKLCAFEPGSMVWSAGRFHTLMDPWRRPGSLLEGALARVGTVGDKLGVGVMRAEYQKAAGRFETAGAERTILQELTARGFSSGFIDGFFRPFFGGITFDAQLGASARMMRFVFKCFSQGDAAVPSLGMGQISAQLAARLPEGCVRLSTPALTVEGTSVRTPSGVFTADRVVVATDEHAACALLGTDRPSGKPARVWRGVTNLNFDTQGPVPVDRAILMLDGEGAISEPSRAGPAINVAFMSSVSPDYAPEGTGLASCTVLGVSGEGDEALRARVLAQMARWFGAERVASWRHLRTYRIERALADQSPPWLTMSDWPNVLAGRAGMYVCGDTTDTASIDGAMRSGRTCAEAVLRGIDGGRV